MDSNVKNSNFLDYILIYAEGIKNLEGHKILTAKEINELFIKYSEK